jgi:hypothetical protein
MLTCLVTDESQLRSCALLSWFGDEVVPFLTHPSDCFSAGRRPTIEMLEPGTSDSDVSVSSLTLPHISRKFTR